MTQDTIKPAVQMLSQDQTKRLNKTRPRGLSGSVPWLLLYHQQYLN